VERTYVVGVGMTVFGRFPDRSIKDLARSAVLEALADAGCGVADVGAAFFANSGQGYHEGQITIRGQVALRPLGLQGIPIVNVENACASGSTAFHMAVTWLRAGQGDVALAVGAEKMVAEDRSKAFGLFEGGWDVHDVPGNLAALRRLSAGSGDGSAPADGSRFMAVYAAFARFHMRRFGTTREQIAAVAAKNHGHSVHNPRAQYRKRFTVAEILAGRPVVGPLTVPMCAPLSDGGAAAVLCSEAALHRFSPRRSATVLASVLRSATERRPEALDRHVSHLAACEAYEAAGVGPGDVSVAEVHDATAMGEIIQVENLGFCGFGEGGELAVRGDTCLGGRLPVNPSGGLESKGHPLGATGLGQIHELVTQLREEAGPRQVPGARVALAENGGGLLGIEEAAACVTILGR
jgi:acetyl-CoA acetyltransferase